MPRYLGLLLFLLLSGIASAQLGITGQYNLHTEDFGEGNGDTWGAYEVQAHYWFRLPNNRIEFQPTVYYGARPDAVVNAYDYQEFGAQFEVNIYPFDFFGDCGCPTFGKQGPQLQKGFFLQLAPGYSRRSYSGRSESFEDHTVDGFIYGGGVGLDIGVTNLLTLTPMVSLRRGKSAFDGREVVLGTGDNEMLDVTQTTYQFGLQATFRFDSRNY